MDFYENLKFCCRPWLPHDLRAGRRAGVPLWPGVCPVPQGGGAVIGLCHADVALGSALDSAEELWHPSPKGDKFGVVGKTKTGLSGEKPVCGFGFVG